MKATPVHLLGTPDRSLTVFDRVLRGLLTLIGVTFGGALAWLELWTWVPIPLAALLVLHMAWAWWRADRPVQLHLADRTLTLKDPKLGTRKEIPLSEVRAATLHLRKRTADRSELAVVLHGRSHSAPVLTALRFTVEPGVTTRPHDVSVDAMDGLIGGYGGLLPGLAPAGVRVRQTFDDPANQFVQHLREALPAPAWQRTAVRVWRGEAPELDLFGLHATPPDGLLILEEDTWTLELHGEPARSGVIGLLRVTRAVRTAKLIHHNNANTATVQQMELPLMLLELDEGITVAVPAPVAELSGKPTPLNPDLLHCHVPEGGAVLWHILVRWPRSAWPAPLLRQAERVLAQGKSTPAKRDPSVADPQR